MRKYVLKFEDNILLVVYLLCLHRQQIAAKTVNEKQLLKQRVDVASCRQILQPCEIVTHLLDRLNVPLISGSPRSSLLESLPHQQSESIAATSIAVKLIEKCKSQFPQFSALEPDSIGMLNTYQTFIDQIINKIVNFLPQNILVLIFMRTFGQLQQQISISHQQLIFLILIFFNNISLANVPDKFPDGFIQKPRNIFVQQKSYHVEKMLTLVLLVFQQIKNQ